MTDLKQNLDRYDELLSPELSRELEGLESDVEEISDIINKYGISVKKDISDIKEKIKNVHMTTDFSISNLKVDESVKKRGNGTLGGSLNSDEFLVANFRFDSFGYSKFFIESYKIKNNTLYLTTEPIDDEIFGEFVALSKEYIIRQINKKINTKNSISVLNRKTSITDMIEFDKMRGYEFRSVYCETEEPNLIYFLNGGKYNLLTKTETSDINYTEVESIKNTYRGGSERVHLIQRKINNYIIFAVYDGYYYNEGYSRYIYNIKTQIIKQIGNHEGTRSLRQGGVDIIFPVFRYGIVDSIDFYRTSINSPANYYNLYTNKKAAIADGPKNIVKVDGNGFKETFIIGEGDDNIINPPFATEDF